MKLKKTLTAVTATALSLTMAFAFTACGEKEDETKATITGITLNETAEIEVGTTSNVIKEVKYSDGTTKTVSDGDIDWKSSAEAIATVNRGIVTAVSKGTANITAKWGEVASNTCAVTVISAREITITGDGVANGKLALEKDAEATLTASVTRDGEAVPDQEIEWSTSAAATVSVNDGAIKAWKEGTATVTAKIKNTSISASVEVTVTWEEPEGYANMMFAEQNKLVPNTWGYWNAQDGWGQGLATDNGVYTEYYEDTHTPKAGYEYIGAEKATFDFEVTDYYMSHTYQIFYRSSDNFTDADGVKGKLKFNHDYEVTLKVKSNVAGTIHVNPYDDIRAKGEDEEVADYNTYLVAQEAANKIKLAKNGTEYVTNDDGVYVTDHDFVLEAGVEKEIKVIFRHDDCGYIYQTTIYDNMGTALHIQLADLSWDKENNVGRRTVFEVYDVQYKDLGAADNPVECDETKHADYVAPPITGTEGETFNAVYTASNTEGDTLETESVWAVWYPTDWGWNCGAPVDMDVALDADAKNCTLAFNPNGNENNWGVQLRYIPAGFEAGQMYKVRLKINTTVAYTITLNGQNINLKVGDNDVEYFWTAGTTKEEKWMVNGQINNVKYEGDITLVLSNLTWTEFTPAE